jgi:cytochrome c
MRIRVAGAPIVQAIITLWILAILAGGVQAQTTQIWTVPEVGALPYDANGLLVRRGRDLITATYAYIGPNVPDVSQRYAGNNLACSNCHLSAGVRKFALPLFGLYGEFPQYSPRSATEITIEDRINSCMTRSMNGQPLPPAASEMQAIVSYIKFLSSGVPAGQQLPGAWRWKDAGAAARRRSKARPHGLRAPLRRLPQHRWVGRAPQHSLFRPRIHDPAAMGSGQLQ